MLARVYSSAVVGLDAVLVEVEVDIASQGLPSFTIVGLPDKGVEEAKERVRSAIKNSGADFPAKRITVNLAPADLPKEGPSYDLPIAVGILLASEQLKADVSHALFMGELALDGRLRHTTGILPQTMLGKQQGFQTVFIPAINSKEASLVDDMTIFPVSSLKTLFFHLTQQKTIHPQPTQNLHNFFLQDEFEYDMRDIKGQEQAKRALEIAASGGHNILLKGPPGAGKTLLARTLPSILPELTKEEALEITKIYSISGLLHHAPMITRRPFRSPHHTTSHVGLIGGSATPKPGDVSLAHRGVLFLDEFPEFPRHVLEALRQPLEDGYVTISRSHGRITFPAQCMVVAAQNPCPCGYYGDTTRQCTCLSGQIIRYQKKISGPLLDRIDIHIEIPAVTIEKLQKETTEAESSKTIRERVQKARNMQTKRFNKTSITTNADMTNRDIARFCPLSGECQSLLRMAVTKMNLSARSYHRIIKMARTIADLEESENIQPHYLAEALQYRPRQQNPLL